MTKDDKARIADYFDGWQLVDFLGLPVEDIIEAFEEDIEERLDEINEEIGYVRD